MSSERLRSRTGRRALWWGLALLVVAATVGAAGEGYARSASEQRLRRLYFFYRFQQGRSYWNTNSYVEAAAYFQSLMGQYNEIPERLQLQLDYYLGTSLYELGLYQWARTHLERPARARKLQPRLAADAAAKLLQIYARAGDRSAVERLYTEVGTRTWPRRLRERLDYAMILARYRLGDHRDIRELATSLVDSPYYPRALFLSALAMLKLDELEAAAADLKTLLGLGNLREFRLEGLRPIAELLLAQIYFDQGSYDRSLRVAERLRGAHFEADVLYLKAWNYVMLDRPLPALDNFLALVERHPEDPRSLEATIIAGYVLIDQNRLPEAYAYFATLETRYRRAYANLERFREGLPNAAALWALFSDPERRAQLPIPQQIVDWVRESRQVAAIRAKQEEIAELGRRLRGVLWEIRRMRILSAGYGNTFENPATLERILRNELGLRLAEIRSRILELMVKPVRTALLSKEYRVINRAQETRRIALRTIDEQVLPAKRRAVRIQRDLRRIRDYLQLIAHAEVHGIPDPATAPSGVYVSLPRSALAIIDRLSADEERLAFLLLRLTDEEERLWGVVAGTIEVERRAAELALRRLGLWGRQRYLDRLETLYRSTDGIERLLLENGKLLASIQKYILNEVLAFMDRFQPEVDAMLAYHEGLAEDAQRVLLAAADRSYRDVMREVRDLEAHAVAGQIDAAWQAREQELQLLTNVSAVRLQRERQLATYYENVRKAAERARDIASVIEARLRAQLKLAQSGEQAVHLDETLKKVGKQVDALEKVIAELLRGSAWILERGGTVRWDQGVAP